MGLIEDDASAGIGEPPRLAVDRLLDDPGTRIVVCCGAGGVGKTTTAAALGLRAAERGRRVVVLTIDPARRLAQSMGLTELDNTPRPVPGIAGSGSGSGSGSASGGGGSGSDGPGGEASGGGELFAMMLDMKRTFDEIVEAHAEPARARAILDNPFYQALSAGFAGTQEYMAMEKLGQLAAREDAPWDLIVVDTPPSRSALDFLDAPQRLGSFLDGRFIRVLMAPAKAGGRAGRKVMNLGMAGLSLFAGSLGKVLGTALLRDVQTFVAAMDTMFGGFRTRADATYRLLQAPGTAFLVVAAPEQDALREAAFFVERLADDRMPLAGLVLNRVHASAAGRLSAERALAAAEMLTGTGNGGNGGNGGAHGANGTNGAGEGDSGGPDVKNLVDGGIVDLHEGQTATRNNHNSQSPADSSSGPAAGSSLGRSPEPSSPADADEQAPLDDAECQALAAGLLRVHADRMRQVAREARMRARFSAVHPEVPVVEVAALPGDVHDLDGLRAIGERLARPDQP
ncbi:ArsA family ATPase [Streptomyces sp. B6B3]|uniref:ArsA family ATPase n=1 Tax=Streptomyces sp. B6B3 TaxID=3153570 RepID=UPI00325F66AA